VPLSWPASLRLCPNFSDWLPGDIVLVRTRGFGHAKDMAIVSMQAASFNKPTRDGQNYVHAAIYVGNGDIVDITAAGVARRSVWTYCQDHAVIVRRYGDLSRAQRIDIAQFALSLVPQGQAYSWAELVKSKIVPGTIPQNNALYCSTLVGLAYQRAAGVQLHARSFYKPLYPGTLAQHYALEVVDLEWRLPVTGVQPAGAQQ
jgi:uncharacterized protein YycO